MPGPILQLPEFLDPAKKSVFDPLSEQIMRRIAGAVGGDDPTNIIGDMMNPTGVPVSGLIAKAPLAVKAARNKILQDHLVEKGLSPQTNEAVKFASQKYPRITSHLLDVGEGAIDIPGFVPGTTAGAFRAVEPIAGWTGKIRLDPEVIKKFRGDSIDSIAEIFGHELTHSAQNLWSPNKWGEKYQMLNDVFGYERNPFEVGARKGGERFKQKMLYPAGDRKLKKTPQEWGIDPSTSIIQKFMDMFDLSK